MSLPARNWRDPNELIAEIAAIMNFYDSRCMDDERGGYINQLTDDGTVFDRDTKHLVGTCRFIFNFAVTGSLLKRSQYRDYALHGLTYLRTGHRQSDGGYAWVMDAAGVADGTRHCYGFAFVLLAAAAAAQADVPGALALVEDTYKLLERRFWDETANLYVDEIAPGDWSAIAVYRGQNANMHMCDAMHWAYRATGESRYLERAKLLAQRVCRELTAKTKGLVWEHYTCNWEPDWSYNKADPRNLFRPYGYLPGHFVEWTKILLNLECDSNADWMLPTAVTLFDEAWTRCWDKERGGFSYAFAPDGTILDNERYYWVHAEAVAAAAALAVRTGEVKYWDAYTSIWDYVDRHFIDHEYGGWYRVLDRDGCRLDDKKSPPAKTDYHPVCACIEILKWLAKEQQK